MKNGLPQVVDVWMSKVQKYGWKIEDAPNEAIRKELRKRLGNPKGQPESLSRGLH